MDYRDFNDYELLSYIAEENEEANEIIYKKYEPLIISISKKFYKYCQNKGLELNDLIQEGRLGLSQAINHFSEKKDTTFYTYAKTCIERKIISLVISTSRLKHKILNDSIPLEINNENDEIYSFEQILEDNSYNPEKILVNNETEQKLNEIIVNTLTDFEKQVFELKTSGFSYKEIAEILEKTPKAIDNAIQRIKQKLKQQLEK